eukprot:TRINITY_DN5403_c0_g1_i1.p1 TRINITY_DN5403_c0_g1~~TRINITY_DN5403_c0_g1_i1.p1  ORF type:complete len:514 (+),score=111.02 TRINITY_DN5403_c0_g1_i1:109-1650(+)
MSFENVCATLEELYLQAAEIRDGNNADYIPELAAVNPELFAISVCSCTGEIWSIGDADIPFSFQSTIKPLLYNIAIQEVGDKAVHDHIGHEPSGQRFNSFTLDEDDKPHNPFNNAGAIMSSALIRSSIPSQVEAFKTIKGFAERASGLAAPVSFDNSVYLSELNTASRNYALTYFMQEKSEFMKTIPVERTLELYLSACALSINCKGLATIAATYASGGVCPITRDEVMDPIHAKASLQLMFNCGMYDYSGRFAFEIGIPAKSGVSGGLFMCVPGRFGIAIWSPPLDRHGNTVRGLWLAKKLVAAYPELHIFGSALRKAQKVMEKQTVLSTIPRVQLLIHAASIGDLEQCKLIVEDGDVDVNDYDYDGRTPLHLALAEGHQEVAEYLLQQGADPEIKDRSGATPRSEAITTDLLFLLPPPKSPRPQQRLSTGKSRRKVIPDQHKLPLLGAKLAEVSDRKPIDGTSSPTKGKDRERALSNSPSKVANGKGHANDGIDANLTASISKLAIPETKA